MPLPRSLTGLVDTLPVLRTGEAIIMGDGRDNACGIDRDLKRRLQITAIFDLEPMLVQRAVLDQLSVGEEGVGEHAMPLTRWRLVDNAKRREGGIARLHDPAAPHLNRIHDEAKQRFFLPSADAVRGPSEEAFSPVSAHAACLPIRGLSSPGFSSPGFR